jgi:Rrf2 family protein
MLIPHAFLQRIVADLSNSGLIDTFPGPRGGLSLAKPPDAITLKDIVTAIDGPITISDCIEEPDECVLEVACPVRSRWARLQGIILHELERTNLKDLAEEAFQRDRNNSRIDINMLHVFERGL